MKTIRIYVPQVASRDAFSNYGTRLWRTARGGGEQVRQCGVAAVQCGASGDSQSQFGQRELWECAQSCGGSRTKSSPFNANCKRDDVGTPPVFVPGTGRDPICVGVASGKMEDRDSLPTSGRPAASRRAAPNFTPGIEEDADPASSPNGARWTHRPHRSERQNTPCRVFPIQLPWPIHGESGPYVGSVGCAAFVRSIWGGQPPARDQEECGVDLKIRVTIVESVNATERGTAWLPQQKFKITSTHADGDENKSQFTPRRIVRSACCAPSL